MSKTTDLLKIMTHLRFLILLITLGVGSSSPARAGQKDLSGDGSAKRVTDDYFGTKITDPYRWMETGPSDAHFVAFLKSQNQATQATLAKRAIPRAKLLARIQTFDSPVAATGQWTRAGSRIFFLETGANAIDAVLRVRDPSGLVRTLLEPKNYKSGDKPAAIDYFQPSNDGKYVAVGVSLGGSEDSTLHVVEVESAKPLPEAISRVQDGSPSWRSDGKSFFYFHHLTTALYENGQTFLHVLGTDPEKDTAVFGPGLQGSPDIPKAGWNNVFASPNSPYVIAFYSAGSSDRPSAYVAREVDATSSDTPWKQILNRDDKLAAGSSVALVGSKLYILSNKESPNGGILVFDLDHLENPPATVMAPSDKVVGGIYGASDALYVSQRNGVGNTLFRLPYNDAATPEQIALPVQGPIFTVDAFPDHPGILFGLDSWIVPPIAYRYDPTAQKLIDTELQPKSPLDFSRFEVREVQASSTDGASVPISIVFQKGIILDGSHPTLLEGFGAYGVTIDPAFSPDTLPILVPYASVFPWIERGGVFAVAHVRGGGEYGERWHVAGQKATKQHTVDDMIAAAKYLIANRYTSPGHLAVRGTSAGGIAVGNAIVQHPELFAAAIDNVGVTNLLRMQFAPAGPANIPEYGDVTKPEDFNWLYALSAYHHIKVGTKYPAVLALTGINDPRVPSWMVAEFVARLQHATSSGKPVLLRVDFEGGHGFGSNRTQREQAAADQLAFLLWQTGD
ncbi:MAG TPA: prolyl oligopeptidase family serine peptidase, partial [Chthoniobacterales bacterium]